MEAKKLGPYHNMPYGPRSRQIRSIYSQFSCRVELSYTLHIVLFYFVDLKYILVILLLSLEEVGEGYYILGEV